VGVGVRVVVERASCWPKLKLRDLVEEEEVSVGVANWNGQWLSEVL